MYRSFREGQMQIAPDINASEWRALRLDDPNSADWEKAVNILAARIRDRYLEPVDFLIASEETKPASQRRFGFTVLAIDCLLVETLGSFLEGLEIPMDIRRESSRTFLRTRKQFAIEFTTDDIANRFYNISVWDSAPS